MDGILQMIWLVCILKKTSHHRFKKTASRFAHLQDIREEGLLLGFPALAFFLEAIVYL